MRPRAINWTTGSALVLTAILGLLFLVNQRSATAYNVCSGGACIHEYMGGEAIPLLPEGADKDEIVLYLDDIKNGITHEDEHDHVYGLAQEVLVTATHFWDADLGPESPTNNADEYFLGEFNNSWQKVRALWLLALGAYANGDKHLAYHYLGHVIHHYEDNTVPAHVHDDPHPNIFPDITGGLDDDSYHVWMDEPGDPPANAKLSQTEKDYIKTLGRLVVPPGYPDPLHWLLYTTNQVADWFASDDFDGDSNDPLGLMGSIFATLPARPVETSQLADNDGCDLGPVPVCTGANNDGDGDLSLIRQYSYLRGIRAVATVMMVFEETAKRQPTLSVVIDRAIDDEADDGEALDETCAPICVGGHNADFFARVTINGYESRNRGDYILNDSDITPGWRFGNAVPTSGIVKVKISLYDHDGLYEDLVTTRGSDEHADIDQTGEEDDLDIEVDVDIAKCMAHQAGAITGDDINGTCGVQIRQEGDSEDDEATIFFRIVIAGPPTAEAGGPYTTQEGTNVELDGTGSTDPDNDIATYAWDLDNDGDCDDVANDSTPDFTTVGQDGTFTVKLCVTDSQGRSSTDTATVTVTNVAPSINATAAPTGENTTLTVSGTISDPGWLETLAGTISWGDGSPLETLTGTLENGRPDATLTFSAPHVYGDNGTFTVQLCATDDDTNPCTTLQVQVNNTNPAASITLTGAVTVNGVPTLISRPGRSLSFQARATDPGSDDLLLTWDWGDGRPASVMNSLVNPPGADALPSPSIQPRDVNFAASHAFGSACAYTTTFTAVDDDLGSASQQATVIITGTERLWQRPRYWEEQFYYFVTHQGGNPDFFGSTLQCYLKITGYMSRVFDEVNDASTFARAWDIELTNRNSSATELFDQQLLAVWLNFANGAFTWDMMVDSNGDRRADMRFIDAVAAAETVRLTPGVTATQLNRQRAILESWMAPR